MTPGVTKETRSLLDALSGLGLPPIHSLTPGEARRMREAAASLAAAGVVESVGSVNDSALDGPGGPVPIRTYTPDSWDRESGGTLVYFHGGGWVMGNLDTHDAPCRGLANASGFRVVAVEYRLAPEHPHPAALEDAWAVTQRVAAASTGPLVVGGDSAGGQLATCVAARARGTRVELAGQLLVYPVTDLSRMDTGSYDTYAEGYWLTRAAMEWFKRHYLADGGDPFHPDASPLLRKDLEGMPHAIVVAAECDVLRDEGVAYARRLEAAGNHVDYRCYDGVIHGFFAMPGSIPEGRSAIDQVGEGLRVLAGGRS